MLGLRLGKLGSVGRAIASLQKLLWPTGTEAGLWASPETTTASYQDSAGTTALSAIGTVLDTNNPVGLMLDRKGGLELGPELVTNGGPFVNTDSWTTITASLSVVSGKLRVANSALYGDGNQEFPTTVGKTYKATAVSAYVSGAVNESYLIKSDAQGGASNVVLSAVAEGAKQIIFTATASSTWINLQGQSADAVFDWDNISVREIPGIHLSQSTSAARPVASARVNWLEQTALMGTAPWALNKVIPTQGLPAWDGALVATKFAVTAETATAPGEYQNSQSGAGARQIVDAKADGFNWISFIDASGSNPTVWFDVLNGVVGTQLPNYMGTIEPLPNGWFRCTMIPAAGISQSYYQWFVTDSDGTVHVNGDGVKGVLLAYPQDTFPNNEFQTVVSNSNYDAEGFPVATKFDGVDDSLASVTFTAGTLTSSMDCLIAVRRNSAAAVVAGLYNAVADATKWFGMAESGSGSGCVGSGAGTPTVWVDNVQLTGGTAVTRGTLHTALTAGSFHILEFRDLDLSTWTDAKYGLYTSYALNGAIGGKGIMLFPSTTDAIRDRARTELAASVGVTL